MNRHIGNKVMGATRKGGSISLCLSFLSFLFASCASDDVPQQTAQQPVTVDFALTVAKFASQGTSGTTRMVSAYTEGTNSDVRLQCAVPFTVTDATVSEPVGVSDTHTSSPVGYFDQPRPSYAFFTSSCEFNQGTNAILAYATPNTTSSSFWTKGAVDATFNDYQPAHISFRLKTIQTREDYLGGDEVTVPEQLANYLTAIANTSIGEGENIITWKAYVNDPTKNANADLKLLFKNFTNQLSDEVGEVLPGSSANIKAWVTLLRTSLNALSLTENSDDDQIRDKIIENIDEQLSKLDPSTGEWKNFPASLHLPDGAAVVRWDGEKFVPETQTTTIADINNLDRLTYPAEIYYYGNSPTWVSSEKLSDNFSSKDKWKKSDDNDETAVLSGFTQGPVVTDTKTVAMFEPLEYGVAQLNVQLQQTTSPTLEDSQKAAITVGNNFKLTGIIVGGQLPVGFDFRPETLYPVYSENDMRFIYDSDVNTNGTDAPFYLSSTAIDTEKYIQTLVLQSYTDKSLKLVLEFENNSESDFKGNNGTVYSGTKFYLVGEVVPESNVEKPKASNRVFTQDHITTIKVTVTSLAKAYNVLPNLMSPRLEMGLELTPKWVQATTTDVIL